MPMYELHETEIKHIESRRRIQNEQSGYRRALRDIINKMSNYSPKSNEEDQFIRSFVYELKKMHFPTDMQAELGGSDARINP